jgi:hypothetical protein
MGGKSKKPDPLEVKPGYYGYDFHGYLIQTPTKDSIVEVEKDGVVLESWTYDNYHMDGLPDALESAREYILKLINK